MQANNEIDDGIDGGWFAQQRAAIEASRVQVDDALALFRRATEALPKLDNLLREHESQANEYRILTDDARRSLEEARKPFENVMNAVLTRLEAAEAALAHSRQEVANLNSRVDAQAGAIIDLSRRLTSLEGQQRTNHEDLHRQVSRLWQVVLWLTDGTWWRRLFGRPPTVTGDTDVPPRS